MNILSTLKRNGWIWQVTIFSIVVGVLLAASLKTRQFIIRTSGIPTTRYSGVAAALIDEKDRNKTLQKEITDLRAKVNEYETALGTGTTKTQLLSDELQKAKFLAGLTPAEGPGVEITLRDKKPPADVDQGLIQEYIIHATDLSDFVNELLANGAEAVAISDQDSSQRITARTPIRCSAGVIRVNDVAMSPPFKIIAIGPKGLKNSLEAPDMLIDNFRFFIEGLTRSMVQIKIKDKVTIPAYSGSTSFKYASLVESEKPK